MAERRRQSDEQPSALAVAEAPSATEAYVARAQELREEEGRLGTLQARQEGGERLSRDEVAEKNYLAETIAQLQNEVTSLVKPMQDEQLALDITDVTAVRNTWAPILEQGFEQWVSSLGIPFHATHTFLALIRDYAAALNSMPAFQHVGEASPNGAELVQNMLGVLPEGGSWLKILLGAQAGLVTNGHAQQMHAMFTPAQPQHERHLARRVDMRRNRRP